MSDTKCRPIDGTDIDPVPVAEISMTAGQLREIVVNLLGAAHGFERARIRHAVAVDYANVRRWWSAKERQEATERCEATDAQYDAAITAQENACDALCVALGFTSWRDVVTDARRYRP